MRNRSRLPPSGPKGVKRKKDLTFVPHFENASINRKGMARAHLQSDRQTGAHQDGGGRCTMIFGIIMMRSGVRVADQFELAEI